MYADLITVCKIIDPQLSYFNGPHMCLYCKIDKKTYCRTTDPAICDFIRRILVQNDNECYDEYDNMSDKSTFNSVIRDIKYSVGKSRGKLRFTDRCKIVFSGEDFRENVRDKIIGSLKHKNKSLRLHNNALLNKSVENEHRSRHLIMKVEEQYQKYASLKKEIVTTNSLDVCPVCLDKLIKPDSLIKILVCGHTYHQDCVRILD